VKVDSKPPSNSFKEVHAKIRVARDNLRKASEVRLGIRQEDAKKEAMENGFDRPATNLSFN
jgi:hypothetical protein